jgi:hypothetical protein
MVFDDPDRSEFPVIWVRESNESCSFFDPYYAFKVNRGWS